MSQVNSKEILSAYISANFGGSSTQGTDKDKSSSGTAKGNSGFDFIMKETLKTSQKFGKHDLKIGEKTSEKSPAILAKRKIEKDQKDDKITDKSINEPRKESVKDDDKVDKSKDLKKVDKDEKVKEVKNEDKVDRTEEPENEEDEKKVKSSDDEAANQLLAFLSQVLNMQPDDVKKLADESGLDLKNVLKEQKVDELSNFISKNMSGEDISKMKLNDKLDSNDKEILRDILSKLNSMADKDESMKDDSTKLEVKDLRGSKDMLKFLENKGSQFRDKIMDPQKESEKIAEPLQTNKEDTTTNKILAAPKEAKPIVEAQQELPPEENTVRAAVEQNPAVKEAQSDKVVLQTIKEALNEKSSNSEKVTEAKGVNAVVSTDAGGAKTQQLNPTIKAAQPTKVFKEAIVDQIVDKAKLTLNNGKNEMSMELKPEHLGKVSLKIASENGTIVAKIIADNEQVKAALESNANMLKESLANQGIKIEGFSVSLSNDRQNQNNNEMQNKRDDAQNSRSAPGAIGKSKTMGNGKGAYDESGVDSSAVRKYYGEKDSSVDFTA